MFRQPVNPKNLNETRERLLTELLLPYGVSCEEMFVDPEVRRGCIVAEERGAFRIVTGPPLLKDRSYATCENEEATLQRMRDDWLPFLSRVMRTAALRREGLGSPMRPSWSILVNAVTLATARLVGIPGERLTRSRIHEGRREFMPLHEEAFEDMPGTKVYIRDGSHHDGADYLRGQFLLNHADHVVRHALQLLEDIRFPIRSVSDSDGRETAIELRVQLPATTCEALAGRPLRDLIGLPGFEAGTPAGDTLIMRAEANEQDGRTMLKVKRHFVPAADPPEGADMRWVAMTPAW